MDDARIGSHQAQTSGGPPTRTGTTRGRNLPAPTMTVAPGRRRTHLPECGATGGILGGLIVKEFGSVDVHRRIAGTGSDALPVRVTATTTARTEMPVHAAVGIVNATSPAAG
ncbi:hypothetical protein [Micromonospora sp. KLBMP9576]|uniref:hypothetical protein n=1 Tax=Micromonospora sp. KLBMP9576 TaxID=3424769 RepID=UPI003D8DA074